MLETMLEEIVHISQSDYNDLVEQAKEVQACTDQENDQQAVVKFIDRNNFPTIEAMKKHRVKYNMRKYLPYLIFYSDSSIYYNEDPEFEISQAYIRELLENYIDIIDDDDIRPVNSVTSGAWRKMSLEDRANVFRELIGYYGRNEFETFLKDLGWKKFMNGYGYSLKNYNEGKEPDENLREDLIAVWDLLQGQ